MSHLTKVKKDKIVAALNSPDTEAARLKVRRINKYRNELAKMDQDRVYVITRASGEVMSVWSNKSAALNEQERLTAVYNLTDAHYFTFLITPVTIHA